MPRPPVEPQLTPDGAAIVPLTKGKVALVDIEDYPRICMFSWNAWRAPKKAHPKWYPSTFVYLGGGKIYSVTMPTVLLGCRRGLEIDHINGDSLDNRRSNLRFVTHHQNMLNAVKPRRRKATPQLSRFKGVTRDNRRKTKQWVGQLRHAGVHHYLGAFETEIEAARAYDKKARELFGEFARLNLPE